jgi:hypothetical protein
LDLQVWWAALATWLGQHGRGAPGQGYQGGRDRAPLTAAPGFKHRHGGDASIFHFNIDKNPRVQAEVVAAIAALPRQR